MATTVQEQVEAMVLAGGLGTRLRAAVSDKPKAMAEVGGKPFLSYLLDQLIEAGISRAVLCVGYMAEQVQDYFQDKYKNLHLSYSVEKALLGTAGALRFALQKTTAPNFIVLNGDTRCELCLRTFINFARAQEAEAMLVATSCADTRRYGRLQVDSDGNVLNFEEKRACGGPGLINAGIYFLKRSFIEEIAPGRNISLERQIFPALGLGRLKAYISQSGNFIDIGTPESLQAAQLSFGACQ